MLSECFVNLEGSCHRGGSLSQTMLRAVERRSGGSSSKRLADLLLVAG